MVRSAWEVALMSGLRCVTFWILMWEMYERGTVIAIRRVSAVRGTRAHQGREVVSWMVVKTAVVSARKGVRGVEENERRVEGRACWVSGRRRGWLRRVVRCRRCAGRRRAMVGGGGGARGDVGYAG